MTVVPFTQLPTTQRRSDHGEVPAGSGGEVIIFPGVRIERHSDAIRGTAARARDAACTGEVYGPAFCGPAG